jgi:hypothetical protein
MRLIFTLTFAISAAVESLVHPGRWSSDFKQAMGDCSLLTVAVLLGVVIGGLLQRKPSA